MAHLRPYILSHALNVTPGTCKVSGLIDVITARSQMSWAIACMCLSSRKSAPGRSRGSKKQDKVAHSKRYPATISDPCSAKTRRRKECTWPSRMKDAAKKSRGIRGDEITDSIHKFDEKHVATPAPQPQHQAVTLPVSHCPFLPPRLPITLPSGLCAFLCADVQHYLWTISCRAPV